VLEPAGLGKAVVIGPSDFNFVDMVSHFRAQRAIVQVEGPALSAAFRSLLLDPDERESLAARAAAAARLLRGAAARHVEWIRRQLDVEAAPR
jgi:3-deoxy-D-manno-octulosonic-acid transferase